MSTESATGQQSQKADGDTVVACTLTEKAAAKQLNEWSDLKEHAITTSPILGGARMVFNSTLDSQIRDLAEREMTCCTFLSISVDTKTNTTLEITSEATEGQAVISRLTGVDLP